MSTSHTPFRRCVRRGALALTVSAICIPAGSALATRPNETVYPVRGDASAAPTPYVGTHYPVAPTAGDTPTDMRGMPDRPVAPTAGDTPTDMRGMPDGPVVAESVHSGSSEGSGFDWTSAAVGAGGAGLLIVVTLGGATAASRMRMRTVRS
jgi:hypothetical protein